MYWTTSKNKALFAIIKIHNKRKMSTLIIKKLILKNILRNGKIKTKQNGNLLVPTILRTPHLDSSLWIIYSSDLPLETRS